MKLNQLFEIRKAISPKSYTFFAILTFVFFLGLWCLLSYSGIINPIFLPTPTKVVNATIELFTKYALISDIGASVFRVFSAFLLASILAVPLGILIGNFKIVEAISRPFSSFVRYMPASAFIPLLILWFGIGHLQKILLIFIGIFFHLLLLISDDATNVPQSLLETAISLGANKRKLLAKVVVPGILPAIINDLRIIIGAAWTFVIVAELVAATSGLGSMIIESQRFLRTANIISGIIIIGFIGLLTDLIFKIAQRLLFPWVE